MGSKITLQKYNEIFTEKFPNFKILSNISDANFKLGSSQLEYNCNIHGKFTGIAGSTYRSEHGCRECSYVFRKTQQIGRTKYSLDELYNIFSKIHNYKYTYEISLNNNKCYLICPIHGKKERYFSSLKKAGCVACNMLARKEKTISNKIKKKKLLSGLTRAERNKTRIIPFEILVKQFHIQHNFKYTYVKESYKGSSYPIEIICPLHGKFKQTGTEHRKSVTGCFSCVNISKSKMEEKWLNSFKLPFELQKKIIINKSKFYKVDGYDPLTNTIYEFLGDFWHGNPKIYTLSDSNPRSKKSYQELFERHRT